MVNGKALRGLTIPMTRGCTGAVLERMLTRSLIRRHIVYQAGIGCSLVYNEDSKLFSFWGGGGFRAAGAPAAGPLTTYIPGKTT